MSRSLDQRRAKHAWELIQEALRIPDATIRKKFGGQAKKMPIRIMSSGIGQAMAFLRAKGYSPLLLQGIADWVLDKRPNPESSRPRTEDDNTLLQRIFEGDVEFLRFATEETISYLAWLTRFAEAEGLTDEEEPSS